jgi:stage V sporulation protein B
VVTFVVYRAVYLITHLNAVGIFISIAAAVIVYAVCLVVMRGMTEEEIAQMPKGTMLIRLLKRFRLL